MGWIEQTKKQSIKSGGPQYYLQGLSENVSAVLGARKRLPLRLWTPYGIAETGLVAVSKNVGSVGHDRVQVIKKGAGQIAAQAAYWYGLKSDNIERIVFEDTLDDVALVISPSQIKFFGTKTLKRIDRQRQPLTFTQNHRSKLLQEQFKHGLDLCRTCRCWFISQIVELVKQHGQGKKKVLEVDILRASGVLHRLGINLGVYTSRPVDCPDATFTFGSLTPYPCPVEIEERSSGFLDSHHDAHRKSRVVVVCMEHDSPQVLSGYTDVIELRSVSRWIEALT